MSNLASMDINTSLYHFPIDDVTLTDGDFDLFGNGHESSYLSYQGWPDTSSYTGEFFRISLQQSPSSFSSKYYSTLDHSSYTNCERKPQFISGMQPDRLRRKLLKNHEQTDGKREDQTSKYASGGSFLIPVTAQQFANPTERSSHSSQNVITLTTEQNTDKLQWNCQMQDFSSNKFQQEGLVNHSAFTEQVPLHTQLHQTQDGVKAQQDQPNSQRRKPAFGSFTMSWNRSEIISKATLLTNTDWKRRLKTVFMEKKLGNPAIIMCICTSESTMASQYLAELALFQLDMRTKLCIRDSLYRLAKSVEQRQVMGHPSGIIGDGIDKSGIMATEESIRFMDMETDTNPIDRSIAHLAHLLFHRPNGRMYFESHITPPSSMIVKQQICRTPTSQLVVTKEMFCQKDVAGGGWCEVADH
ncbi:hypothetical protein IFM89_005275 [Coptis chinensis]|uniref:Uncharacterized protein n=1 Tax=Coptis chinensis TaxID=261450 RepID=A0A835M8P3_9MAGN|nr:hypothetical protein IFM89_005275 [Coptis chinensis]